MNFFNEFKEIVVRIVEELQRAGELPGELPLDRIAVDPPREESHGDLATNAALVLAKPAGVRPRDLAERLAVRLREHPDVVEAAVAGPGFVNIRLAATFWHARLVEILRTGRSYGAADLGRGEKVNVEYVSANPTGPLHVGHGRGTVIGDVLASLLETVGYDVTREYYINDAGQQIEQLAYSVYWRYREALGEEVDEEGFRAAFPGREWEYRGAYLKPVGEALAAEYGDRFRDPATPAEEWLPIFRDFAVEAMMRLIRDDLAALGVRHDVFTSERALVEAGRVDEALAALEARGLIYTGVLEPPKGRRPEDWEPRPQTLFRSTEFGDDVDRPLRKSDGTWTYFASDIANHFDKYRRGFRTLIDVWGADHGGYVKRMAAAVRAITDGEATLDVKLCQMVNLLDDGVPVRMSKRAGTFVTLAEVVERVGKDVFRFMMLTRKNDAQLDFDLARATEQSRDNPVFYVQYAHARCRSVMRLVAAGFPDLDLAPAALAAAPVERLEDPAELALIRMLATWPRIVEGAAEAHEPHRLAFFLYDLAGMFHALWNKGRDDPRLRFIMDGDAELTAARLALVQGVALVIASGLQIFGVEPVEEMR